MNAADMESKEFEDTLDVEDNSGNAIYGSSLCAISLFVAMVQFFCTYMRSRLLSVKIFFCLFDKNKISTFATDHLR